MADEKNSLPMPMTPISAPKPTKSTKSRVRNALLAVVTLSCIAWLVVSRSGLFNRYLREASVHAMKLSTGSRMNCHQADVLSPQRHANVLDTISDLIGTDEYQSKVLESHAEAIRIQTEVYDDMRPVGQDDRWEVFLDLHKHLHSAYPLLHDHLEMKTVNQYGLIYTWQGSDESLAPILLTAHQDVVPVEEDTLDEWEHLPFSADYDGEYVWGRGASDDKSRLTAVMNTIETLVDTGFHPLRTIVLSVGFDEQLSGAQGSGAIATELEDTYGDNMPFALIIDEGGAFSGNDRDGIFASPGVAEKGYLDVEIEVTSPGGHSSRPPAHTTIGMLAAAITKYEDNPFPLNLDRDSAPYRMLQCRAQYSPSMPRPLKQLIDLSQFSNIALAELEEIIFREETYRQLIGTTQAVDVIQGGVKSNSLPGQAAAVVNHRISTSSSVAETMDRDTALLQGLARRFNLNFDAFGSHISTATTPAQGTLTLEIARGNAMEPVPRSPVSGRGSEAYGILAGSIKAAFNDYRRLDHPNAVIVSPGLSTENTGSRYYRNLSRNIFRYSHKNSVGNQRPSGAHGVNEVIRAESLFEMIQFFTTLILNADESTEI